MSQIQGGRETHVALDTVNDYVTEPDDSYDEPPTLECLVTSLRIWASTFSVSLVALTALFSILHACHLMRTIT